MILDIDVGNTRIKWRLSAISGIETESACARADLESELCQINRRAKGAIERVRVANVAGKGPVAPIESLCRQYWGVEPEFARCQQILDGFRTCYRPVVRLGVDRWLAALAAYRLCGGASVVVDAGSAITVDLVSGEGTHVGGYIVPGFDLLSQALFSGTEDVKVEWVESVSGCGPGQNTEECVVRGCLEMVLGLIERARNHLPERQVAVLLTGGNAAILLDRLPEARHEPGLVLDGLAIALP